MEKITMERCNLSCTMKMLNMIKEQFNPNRTVLKLSFVKKDSLGGANSTQVPTQVTQGKKKPRTFCIFLSRNNMVNVIPREKAPSPDWGGCFRKKTYYLMYAEFTYPDTPYFGANTQV